jgi:hypothetical protein
MPAKKSTTTKAKKAAPVTKTKSAVKNTPLPKVATKKAITITEAMVAKRAFEIHCGGTGGSELDNWYRAERELKAGL